MEDLNLGYIGPLFKQARLNAKLTQEELAACIGVTPRYIMAIENEGKKPALPNLIKIIRILNISADTIVYPEANIINEKNEKLIRMLQMLNDRDKEVIISTVQTMLEHS